METLENIITILGGIYVLTLLVLGFVQPLSAIIRILSTKRQNSTYAIGLKRYLFAVVAYFFLLSMLIEYSKLPLIDSIYPIYLYGIPAIYAIWYIKYIRIWKRKNKNIKAYDKIQLLNAPHEDRLLLDSYPKKKVKLTHPIAIQQTGLKEAKETIIRSLPNLTLAQ